MNEEKCILWNHSGEITLTVLYSSTILTEGLLFKFELFWIQTNKDQAQAQKSGNNLPQCLSDTEPQEIVMKMGKVTRGPDGNCKAQGAWTIEDAVVSAACSVERSEPHQLWRLRALSPRLEIAGPPQLPPCNVCFASKWD
jgi:hypothetical protein